MFTEAVPSPSVQTKRSMTTKMTMLAAGAAVSVAVMAGATPAMAQEYPSPDGSSGQRTPAPPVQGDGLDVNSVVLGSLAGIALAGAGLGISVGRQRRRDHVVTPTV
jgi:hypothetical protein